MTSSQEPSDPTLAILIFCGLFVLFCLWGLCCFAFRTLLNKNSQKNHADTTDQECQNARNVIGHSQSFERSINYQIPTVRIETEDHLNTIANGVEPCTPPPSYDEVTLWERNENLALWYILLNNSQYIRIAYNTKIYLSGSWGVVITDIDWPSFFPCPFVADVSTIESTHD